MFPYMKILYVTDALGDVTKYENLFLFILF